MKTARLDHVCLHTRDFKAAVQEFEGQGFVVQYRADAGPSHGTEYGFVVFESGAYVLIMEFVDPAKQKAHRLGDYLDTNAVLVDYGIAVSDHAAADAAARSAGLVPSDPVEYHNTLEDGRNWGLRLLTMGRGAPKGHDALPFVITDLELRSARVPAYAPHPNGLSDLRNIHLEAQDAAAAAKVLNAVTKAQPVDEGQSWKVQLDNIAVVLHERDPLAPLTPGMGGILQLDAVAATSMPDVICHGAKITVIAEEQDDRE